MQLTAVLAEQTFIFPYLIIFILSGVNSKYERHLSEALGGAVISHLQFRKRLVPKNRQETSKYLLLPIMSSVVRRDSVMSSKAQGQIQAGFNPRNAKHWGCEGGISPPASAFPYNPLQVNSQWYFNHGQEIFLDTGM